jgi:DNA-directed RNA polymerase subunit delta
MGIPHEIRPDMPVTDLAFYILKNRGQKTHFKELITEIMRVKAMNQDNPGRLIAQMHTEINLDSRFIHHGAGEWGLREWMPKNAKVVRIRPESSSPAPTKCRAALRSEDDEDDFGLDEEDEDGSEDGDDESDSEPDDYYKDEEER